MQLSKWICLVCLVALQGTASAEFEEDYETKRWQEMEVQLPAAPKLENLQSFYVSAATGNQFFIDLASASVGGDGVVRYTLLVAASGGARNVSFEGIRCLTKERRIYASGRRDGGWSKSRNNEWVRIQDEPANRTHAALYIEYFCPGGVIVRNTAEAQDALKRGGHPDNKLY
mgnify:CR=1 FL=1